MKEVTSDLVIKYALVIVMESSTIQAEGAISAKVQRQGMKDNLRGKDNLSWSSGSSMKEMRKTMSYC